MFESVNNTWNAIDTHKKKRPYCFHYEIGKNIDEVVNITLAPAHKKKKHYISSIHD